MAVGGSLATAVGFVVTIAHLGALSALACAFATANLRSGWYRLDSMIPLHTLAPGHSATIRQLMGKPDDVRRLEELGLRAGVLVEMVDSGVPCIIRLAGAKLCFRGAEAFQVMVASPE